MNITIVGGGNIGTQFAVHCIEKGNDVVLSTSRPEKISEELTIVDETGVVAHSARLNKATSDSKEAFSNADLIYVTVPAYCMKDVAERILPYARKDLLIGLIPGIGGGECIFSKCIEKGATVFGLQRVPSVARLVEYGRCVCATGYRPRLYLTALPHSKSNECASIVADTFDMPCETLPNYLNVTLTPSNPILHTTRLRTIFSDFRNGIAYSSVPLTYEDWDDASSELLLACDDELQRICSALTEFDLGGVKSLRIHYESETVEQLTKKIRSIRSLQGLETPTIRTAQGLVPDFQSRYFTADFPYGLSLLMQVASFAEVDVPNMRDTLEWYRKINSWERGFEFADYGITNREEFVEFYSH